MIREILTYPDKRLRQKSKDVEIFDEKLHKLLDDMYQTMITREGVGLAAIQIGISKRILIINPVDENTQEQRREDLVEIINPKIISKSGEIVFNEGCLSVPGVYEEIKRYSSIEINYFNRFGDEQNLKAKDFLAVAIQHEIDHLDGHLFIEKLSILKRKKFEKEWKKRLKSNK